MATFFDFKKPFETIDRKIMLKKPYMYGTRRIELKWFKSYLQNRNQTTKLSNSASEKFINNVYNIYK